MVKTTLAAVLTFMPIVAVEFTLNQAETAGLREIQVSEPAAPERAAGSDKSSRSGQGYLDGLDEKMCPRPEYVDAYSAVCGVKDAAAIFKANQEHRIAKLPIPAYNIVELGLWPDDSTDTVFSYYYELYSSGGKKIGYAALDGCVNSEMGSRIKLLTKYTLDGKIASVTVIPW